MPELRTVCNICHVRCPVVAHVEDDHVARLEADTAHPYGGLMCVKGQAAGELVDHPDRLRYPLKRISPKTAPAEWVRVSWDEALDAIADHLREIGAEHGAEAIVFAKGTPSGTGMADSERWVKRLANALGTPNNVGTTHLCQWPRDEGTKYTFGVALPWPDLERVGCLLLWGHNPAATNIRFAHEIQRARARGMKLVVVDPRRVGLATSADVHLAVQPGTDGALALALAHVLVAADAFDREFVREWTNAPLLVRRDTGRLLRWGDLAADDAAAADYVAWAGRPVRYTPRTVAYEVPSADLDLEAAPTVRLADGTPVETATGFRLLRELLQEFPPERAAEITTVPADQIRAAAECLAHHRPAAHYFWNGLTQHTNAAQSGRAISLLYALLGDFDAPGGNVLGRPAPLNHVELNGALSPEQEQRRLGWAERPLGAPRTTGGSAAYDLYESVLEEQPYRVRALLTFGSNVVMSNGGSLQGRAALEQLDFMVCVDYFLTPTAQLADYVLPVASFLECPTLISGWKLPFPAQSHLHYRPAVLPPRGEVRSDTQIVFDLAVRLGLDEQFWQGDVEAAYRHELEPSGVTLEALKANPEGIATRPVQPPLGERAHAQPGPDGAPKGFNTPTRKVELYASRFAEHGQSGLPRYEPPAWSAERNPEAAREYPLVLTNAKTTQFCHSQLRALPSLRRARPHPRVELHPDTAAQAGVANGAWTLVETPEGQIRVQVRFNRAVKPGVVVAEHGWWQNCEALDLPGYAPFSPDGANANLLVSNRHRDPISGGTPHRSARCRLRPVDD
jgi:anaerobic selenocysteine-containing dehydrogenase